MSEQGERPPAGWYNDPTTANQQRWWDGTQWGSSTRPLTDGPPPVDPLVPPVGVSGAQPSDWTTPTMPPPLTAAPGQTPTPVPISGGSKRSARLFLIAGACIVLLGGCITVLGASSDAPDTTAETADDAAPLEATDEPEPAPEPAETEDDLLAAFEEPPDIGSRQDPLPYDQPIDLTWSTVGDADGSIWTTTIGQPRDITDAVLAANDFNDPPPEGVRFVGFEAEMTLVEADVEPLAPSFNVRWEIFGGSTARVYNSLTIDTESFGCGVTPNSFDDSAEAFPGGTLSGTVCLPIPEEDLGHPDTRVSLRFADGNRAIFGP